MINISVYETVWQLEKWHANRQLELVSFYTISSAFSHHEISYPELQQSVCDVLWTSKQYLFKEYHPAYLVFAQQYFGGERWGADIIRSGVRRDRYQCPNFAVLTEDHEYVIAELCADDLCWNPIDFVLCLSRSDNRLRRRHFANPGEEKETGDGTWGLLTELQRTFIFDYSYYLG